MDHKNPAIFESSLSCSETAGTTVNSLASGPKNTQLEKVLECPLCGNIPLPPIYTCSTGHFICYPCKLKIEECPLCSQPYTTTRNFPLESIVQTSTFHCNHKQHGCNVELTAKEFIDHHEICPYRPMKCHLSESHDCKGTLLYLSDYLEHLKQVHGLPTYDLSQLNSTTTAV